MKCESEEVLLSRDCEVEVGTKEGVERCGIPRPVRPERERRRAISEKRCE